MNYDKACKILELPIIFDNKILKQNYYLKALKYHPDKNNNSDESNIEFKEISNAYNYLYNLNNINTDVDKDVDKKSDNKNLDDNIDNTYFNILEKFMDCILTNNKDNIAGQLINLLKCKSSEISMELLKNFPRELIIKFHKFIIKYHDILCIKDNKIIDKLEGLLKEYRKNDNIVVITPSLKNLINDDVYKLELDNETYLIPLWHHELIYEVSNNLLIVQCEPILEKYMMIDEYNNLCINLSTTIKSIFNKNNIIISI